MAFLPAAIILLPNIYFLLTLASVIFSDLQEYLPHFCPFCLKVKII